MRLYQIARLKHACGGKTAVSAVKECSKTAGVVSGYLLGKSCTGVSGPFYLPKVKANIWHGCKSLFYTTNSVCNTHRKHVVRGFSSKHAYEDAFAMARDKPEKFWSKAAQGISWFEHWTQTLDNTDTLFPKWFVGGKLNVCYNAVDRHVENGRGDQAAVIYDSPVTATKQVITYREMQDEVSRLAGVLASHGVKMGDLVVIYMPMVPQAMFTMLACARIGATHSLIFGGFASKELSVRIDHAKPKLLVTASFGIEPGRKVEYIPLVDKALELSSHKPHKVLIYNRPGMEKVSMHPDLSLDWEEEMATARPHDCVSVPAHHPLYVLYTSGTTGTPKGVVRDSGSYAVMLNWTMSNVYGLAPGEVWWAASDFGWVVGHSYICYGPLLHGNTTVLYEGKPVGTPDPGAFFRVMSEHGTASMFTAPTAIRAIRQQDPQAEHGKRYPLRRLRNLFVAGERCDIETLEWAKKNFRVPVLDHWWQTESGSAITASCIGLGCSRTPPAGTAGKPVPGYNVTVIDDEMQQVKPRTLGNIVVKRPLPPGAALNLWQNEELFKDLYFTKFPGYYDTMDAGFMDEEGFVYIMSRSDDVINVAGHRLSTGALEEAVLLHPAVVDCAVVGLEDSLKGHVPLALCVLRNDCQKSKDVLVKEIASLVRDTIGPVAAFRKVLFVKVLPKTRSGKIPRSSLANLVNRKPYKVTPTIEDPEVFKDIEKVARKTLKGTGK
ncbi:acyl-CoA synthetase short-chain family member 3, mitochondrial [Triplophysa rosa]|uniref:Acyl-CoA synthetase short-chain family member 3, mitochondrial n=1 Tax=Triplophysa rosa TaxID=992332 RepID=A0A9W7WA10_TRIRA|nr:acyl-CoA synthetase short-chain family member 3, mitochondrial [Triplophysa rosa]KAI7791640.1 putative acyl-CoA synthetase short-chain family member 3 [Triplophysa rosa]